MCKISRPNTLHSNSLYPDVFYPGMSIYWAQLYRQKCACAACTVAMAAQRRLTKHEPTLPPKSKRALVMLEKKMDIVRKLQNGHSQRAVANRHRITKLTAGDIWKYFQKIKDCMMSSESLVYAKKCCVVCEPNLNLKELHLCNSRNCNSSSRNGVILQFARDKNPSAFLNCGQDLVPCCPDIGCLGVLITT